MTVDFHESLADRRIREAMERGEFDRLPGEGAPIPDIDRPYDPAWWARRWIERERARDTLHDAAASAERALGAVWTMPDERAVREGVDRLNVRIRRANDAVEPADRAPLLDPDATVRIWRRMQAARRPRPA